MQCPRDPGLSRGLWSRVTDSLSPGDLESIPLLGPWDWAEHPAAPSSCMGPGQPSRFPCFGSSRGAGVHTGTPQPRAEAEKGLERAWVMTADSILQAGWRAPCWGLWSRLFTPTPAACAFSPGLWGRVRPGWAARTSWVAGRMCLRPFP